MEDVFKKLCKIAAGIESDQNKIEAKEREVERMREIKELEKRELAKDKERDEAMRGIKKPNIYSRKMSRVVEVKSAVSAFKKKSGDGSRRRMSLPEITKIDEVEEETEEECEKKAIMDTIIAELKDPNRDFNNFDPGKRARELFDALDEDGSGTLTEDEFIDGCMTDEAFVQLLKDFNGDFIWNS